MRTTARTPVSIRKTPASNSSTERRPITMLALVALVLVALVALSVVGFALHLLFTPWILVAIAIVAWIKFRPSRTHR
jgi:uncharacterized membrane protein